MRIRELSGAEITAKIEKALGTGARTEHARIAELEAQILRLKDEVGDEWARAEQAIARNAALAAENAYLLTRITQLREYRDQMLELTHRAEQAEAARNEMMDEMYKRLEQADAKLAGIGKP